MVEPGAGVADRLAGKDRLQPFEIFNAGRTQTGRVKHVRVAHHAHHQRNGMPAAGDQAAVHRNPRRRFVDVEWLRIELFRKGDDLVFVDALLANLTHFTDLEILPVILRFFQYHIVITNVLISPCSVVPSDTRADSPGPCDAARRTIAGLPLSVSQPRGALYHIKRRPRTWKRGGRNASIGCISEGQFTLGVILKRRASSDFSIRNNKCHTARPHVLADVILKRRTS